MHISCIHFIFFKLQILEQFLIRSEYSFILPEPLNRSLPNYLHLVVTGTTVHCRAATTDNMSLHLTHFAASIFTFFLLFSFSFPALLFFNLFYRLCGLIETQLATI